MRFNLGFVGTGNNEPYLGNVTVHTDNTDGGQTRTISGVDLGEPSDTRTIYVTISNAAESGTFTFDAVTLGGNSMSSLINQPTAGSGFVLQTSVYALNTFGTSLANATTADLFIDMRAAQTGYLVRILPAYQLLSPLSPVDTRVQFGSVGANTSGPGSLGTIDVERDGFIIGATANVAFGAGDLFIVDNMTDNDSFRTDQSGGLWITNSSHYQIVPDDATNYALNGNFSTAGGGGAYTAAFISVR